ncbi:C-X-C chemokine receptor type 2 [Photinus pyralis]|uniref:C-X-C chemokine receptor type 2 n=1 Tax=Photinus pyralis TaxID=7054 RepID=UPI001267598F|nr:C-X-C chemokine receptor type 2 [Photinus pyralis]
MEYITSLYGCMFLVGLLGNGSLGLTLCCGPGAKARSPLLLGLVAADFLVCCLSGPVTAAIYVTSTLSQTWLRVALFVQAWPVSASTLSMMAISVDRYLTVKNYRPAAQVVRRRHLLAFASVVAWILAALLSSLQLIQRNPWRTSLLIIRAVLAHVVPICVVFASHLGVHSKLTALSLTARAKHGELPLPMPLLRRPTNVIIVAGIPSGIDNKALTSEQNGKKKAELDTENAEQPPTSTLQSRRRLANALMWMAFVFAACWLPYVLCIICAEFNTVPSIWLIRYSLFLGHVHSAFSPLLYWALNHKWLQPPCRFRLPVLYRNASSTNEAALGPFNPRFARPPPVRRQSSHYLY